VFLARVFFTVCSLDCPDLTWVNMRRARSAKICAGARWEIAIGEGPVLHSEHGPMSWNAVSPGTPVSRIVDVACALT